MNMLSASGAQLALGIIGFVFAVYYLSVGIMEIVWPSMPATAKRVFNIISISLFPTFMFIYFIFAIVNSASQMGPSLWVITIVGMLSALTLAVFYIISRFAKNEVFVRLASLFGMIFTLCIICAILFAPSAQTFSAKIGDIEIVPILIYSLYCSLMFNSLKKEA